jgi:hypothetical protein
METSLIQVTPLVDIKIIRETLLRCSIINHNKKEIYPSCYLIKIEGKYFLAHFKQILVITKLDAYNGMLNTDYERILSILFNLKNWKMIDIVDDVNIEHTKFIQVLPYAEKKNYKIVHKINQTKLNQYK